MIFTRKEAIEFATIELENQALDFTEQFLQVHQILYRDNKPVIARVDDTREREAFFVYFTLQQQPYFYVLVIRIRNYKLTIDASYVEARVRVYLSIKSEELNVQQINELIGLTSTKTKYFPRAKFNNWQFEPQKDIPEEIERKLDYLLNSLELYKDNIARLAPKTHSSINIVYKGYQSCMSGWHLTREQIKRIAELRCKIDLDLYAYGDDLPE